MWKLDSMGRTQQHWTHKTSYGSRRGYINEDSYNANDEGERQQREWQGLTRRSTSDIVLKGWRYDGLGNLKGRRDSLLGEQRYAHDITGRVTENVNVQPGFTQYLRNDPNKPKKGQAPGSGGIKPEYFRWDASDNMLPASPDFVDLASVGRVENNRVVEWQDIRIEYDGIGWMSKKVAGDARERWHKARVLPLGRIRQHVARIP